jgi:hypothetical protein
MRKILIPITFLVILYCIAWFVYAGYMKHFLIAKMSQTFAELGLGTFENEGVSASGFPFKIVVTLKNPKTNINSGEIFKKFAEGIPVKPGMESELPDLKDLKWNDQLSIDGDLEVSTNLLATEYHIKRTGTTRYASDINGKKFVFSTKGDDGLTTISFYTSPLITDYKYKLKDDYFLKQLFLSISQIAFVQGKNTVFEDTSGEVLISSDGSNFAYDAKKIDATNSKIELKTQTTNTQITEKFAKIVTEFLSNIVGKENASISDYSRNGVMNSEIHLVYTGALDKEAFKKENTTFDLEFVKFNYSDDLSKTSLTGDFNFVTQNSKPVSVNLKWKNNTQFDKKWYDRTIEDSKSLKLALANSSTDGEIGKVADILRKLSASGDDNRTKALINSLLDNAEEVTPKLHEWGDIKFEGDIAFDGKETGKLTIKQFDFVTNLFGLKISGDAQQSVPMPRGNLSISFINYSKIVDGLFAYIRKTLPLFEVAAQKSFPFEIKEGFEGALKSVMVDLSETPEKSGADVVITLRADEKTPMPMIGKLMLPQATIVAQSKLAPFLVPVASEVPQENPDQNSGLVPSEPQPSTVPPVENTQPQIQQ